MSNLVDPSSVVQASRPYKLDLLWTPRTLHPLEASIRKLVLPKFFTKQLKAGIYLVQRGVIFRIGWTNTLNCMNRENHREFMKIKSEKENPLRKSPILMLQVGKWLIRENFKFLIKYFHS
jgi:hypothetical protein